MLAVLVEKPVPAEGLNWVKVPKPKLEGNDANYLIVKVEATALNRADVEQRKGDYPPPPGESNIMGLEISGVVEAIGENFKNKFKTGDRVFGLLGSGGYAQFAKVHGSMLMHIPERLSFEEAAGIPVVWLSAYQALFWLGEFDKRPNNRTILIHAGASGVGTAAIQLSKLGENNRVYFTAGTDEKIKFCTQLGATQGINYKKEDFAARISELTENKGVDMLMDFIGASNWDKNLQSLSLDGIMTMQGLMGGAALKESSLVPFLRKRIQVKGSTLRTRTLDYKIQLTKSFSDVAMHMFAEGKFKSIIGATFPMDQVVDAHKFMEADQNIGKIILKIGSLPQS